MATREAACRPPRTIPPKTESRIARASGRGEEKKESGDTLVRWLQPTSSTVLYTCVAGATMMGSSPFATISFTSFCRRKGANEARAKRGRERVWLARSCKTAPRAGRAPHPNTSPAALRQVVLWLWGHRCSVLGCRRVVWPIVVWWALASHLVAHRVHIEVTLSLCWKRGAYGSGENKPQHSTPTHSTSWGKAGHGARMRVAVNSIPVH